MNIHVTPKDGKWQVKKGGAKKATKLFDTQKNAEAYGKKIAQKQQKELLTHGRDGKIRKKTSYGNDPYPPRG
ncbi:DUF2188 domain-containing protein [Anaerosalibacter bizertensis]|uniref:DUF2188 domain-containing protein n=1 Tax=Anaerosalibacter bizertensis TaxID=932217 RepID=A0A844FJ90_9FIRM|nr:DUF2188 domain-containing protein [Anaerosalibacter bizertensis]MSS44021.1 DUF2188 domain-containing protein [Anaerosalibacter bizertensis]